MATLKEQIERQKYWLDFIEAEKEHGYAYRGDKYYYKYNNKQEGIVLGSVILVDGGKHDPGYLVKVGPNATLNSRNKILFYSIREFREEFQISLKEKLSKL